MSICGSGTYVCEFVEHRKYGISALVLSGITIVVSGFMNKGEGIC